MKHFFALVALLMVLANSGPVQAIEGTSADGFMEFEQKARLLLQQADSDQELESLNQQLLEMYLWSKDNLEPRQWPLLAANLDRWPAILRQRSLVLTGNRLFHLKSLEVAYWLLLHDYSKTRQLLNQLSSQKPGPYPELMEALLGEQDPDNPGIWRISLEQARTLVRRYPQLELTYLLLTEAVLERIQEPGSQQAWIKEAQWAVNQVLRQNPQHIFARYQQGQLLYLNNKPAEARLYFEKQVIVHNALAAEAVGNFYSWMQDLPNALWFYEAARQQSPRTLRIYQKMEQLYLQSQPDAAARLYLRGLALAPDEMAFYQRLQTLYHQIAPEKLKSWLPKELPAGSYMTRLILGDLAWREGDTRSAEHWYHIALEQQPRSLPAYLNLLALGWEQHKMDEMGQLLDKAHHQGLKNTELDYWQGTLALQQGKPDQAIALLEPLVHQDSRSVFSLAMAYRQKHDFAKARQLLASLIEHDARNVVLILTLGDIYREAQNYAQAEEVYRLAQHIEPYNPVVAFSFGNLYAEIHRYDQAVEAFQRAILMAPDNLDFRNNLGNVYLRQGQVDAALQEFELILEKQPDFAQAYYNLACAYAISQQKSQAITHLKRALALDPSLKQLASQDHDLDFLRTDSRFQELLR